MWGMLDFWLWLLCGIDVLCWLLDCFCCVGYFRFGCLRVVGFLGLLGFTVMIVCGTGF